MNYQHLFYFWTVANCGSIAAASRRLRLTPPTLSAQIRSLEESIGQRLFERGGRGLELTDLGRIAMGYADEIFSLGAELRETLGRSGTPRLRVGIEDALTPLLVQALVAPALTTPSELQVIATRGAKAELADGLVGRELDIVLTSGELPSLRSSQLETQLLQDGDVAIYAAPALAARLRGGYPGSIDRAPMLLPSEGSTLRTDLERWFAARSIRPEIKAELADGALVDELGAHGVGAFAACVRFEGALRERHGVVRVGLVDGVKARLMAVTAVRRKAHPAVGMLLRNAGLLLAPRPQVVEAERTG